jgi:capsular exopolysaccharide synthesis family protein
MNFKILIGENGSYTIAKDGGWFGSSPVLVNGQLGKPAAGGGLSLLLKPAVGDIAPLAGRVFRLKVTSASAVQEILQNSGSFTVMAGGVVADPTKIANLQFLTPNPYAGSAFINQLMNDFIASQVSWNNQAASVTQDFIAQQLAQLHASVADADQKLAAYQARTGILNIPENAKIILGQLSQYEVQKTNLALQQKALQQLDAEITHPLARLNPYLLSQTGDSVLGQLTVNLTAEETKLQALQSQFTADAPDVQTEQANVDEIEAAIRSVIGNELASTNHNLAALDAVIEQLNVQLRVMPAESLQVIALTRASDVYGQIYVLLMQKEEEAEVSKAASIVDTRIVTPADIPLRAAAPKMMVILVAGVLLGFTGSVAFLLIQRSLSTRMQSEEEIRRLVRLPVYGVIPRRDEAKKENPILIPHPQTAFAEALRLLRGNIQRSGTQKSSHVLLLSSAGVDDGKTTIAVNLAKTFADAGKRVILVDADLHHGRIHELLHCGPSAGLTEWLVTMNKPQINEVPGQRFMMLAAGLLPPNASELLSEPYLSNIISNLRAEFDYVVIDSPPLPAVADGMVLGEQADLILSVVMIEHTGRRALAMHNELLSKLDCRHGIIINGVEDESYGYGYGYGELEPAGAMSKFRRLMERA